LVPKATEFGEIMAMRHSRSFKVTYFGISRKPVCNSHLWIVLTYLAPFQSYLRIELSANFRFQRRYLFG